MELRADPFGRRSLICAGVGVWIAAVTLASVLFDTGLPFFLLLLMLPAVCVVGAFHGLVGLWLDTRRVSAGVGLVLNAAGCAASLWVILASLHGP